MKDISFYTQKIIFFSFCLLFFLTPLLFYPLTKYFPFPWDWFGVDPLTYELFEFNKMYFVYGFTVVILGAWVVRCFEEKRIIFRKTFLDYPLALFLVSQIISTIISIDQHTSWWGYYSRFHGGLVSSLCYVLLYWALVSNTFSRKAIHWYILSIITSATIVSFYGIAQRLGIDADFWVQNVRARVFASLGQPNWLAAFLIAVTPISLSYFLNEKRWYIKLLYLISGASLFLSLLFTGSRSGLLALVISLGFYASLYFGYRQEVVSIKQWIPTLGVYLLSTIIYLFLYYKYSSYALTASFVFLMLSLGVMLYKTTRENRLWFGLLAVVIFIIGIFNFSSETFRFATSSTSTSTAGAAPAPAAVPQEAGGTETGRIRFIVWKGALEIFRQYPIFGSGVETFAYSFYQVRPLELLQTTEWDFLYNKAHNEFLNILATTGLFGMLTYLFLVGMFFYSAFNFVRHFRPEVVHVNLKDQVKNLVHNKKKNYLDSQDSSASYFSAEYSVLVVIALSSSMLSILITNFFGFSVVNIGIFFFLWGTFLSVLFERDRYSLRISEKIKSLGRRIIPINKPPHSLILTGLEIACICFAIVLLSNVVKFWFADIAFAEGRSLNRSGKIGQSYTRFINAINLRNDEPFYFSELGWTQSAMTHELMKDNDASSAAELAPIAEENALKAVEMSPHNVSYWKKLSDVYYNLGSFDKKEYAPKLVQAAERTRTLAPTDVSNLYNLSTYYEYVGDTNTAIEVLEQSVEWKPDYADGWYRLGEVYYHRFSLTKNADDEKRAQEYQRQAQTLAPGNEEYKIPYLSE